MKSVIIQSFKRVVIGFFGLVMVIAMLTPMTSHAAALFRKKSRASQDAETVVVSPENLRLAVHEAMGGHWDLVSKIVRQHGVNVIDKMGRSLLHYACGEDGGVSVVNFLIAKHADVNLVDVGGDTPLIKAVRANNIDVVTALIDARVDMEKVYKRGDTALAIASDCGYDAIAEALIKGGAFEKSRQVDHRLIPAG